MLSKNKYPMLNRQQRRHPARMVRQLNLNKGWGWGGNFLLAGLLIRAGVTPRINAEGAQV